MLLFHRNSESCQANAMQSNNIGCSKSRRPKNAFISRSLIGGLPLPKVIILSLSSSSALGAGFSLTDFSVKGMGSAYAGTTAGVDEAATIYWNPAGLARLDGVQLQGGVVYVDFRSRFRDEGSTQTLPNPYPPPPLVTVPSTGGDENADGNFAIPNGYLSIRAGERVTLGLGVQTPFGLDTSYDSSWAGRYHVVESSLATVDINPSIAYRIDENWSLGAGVSAQYLDASLSKAVFTGGADGLADLNGDDWAGGFNLGILFEPNDRTRIGLSYRSGIDHEIKGTRTLSGLGPLDGGVGAKVRLKLPPNLAFGIHHRVNDKLTLMGDVTWTGWSSFDELRISFDDGSPDDVTVGDWNDNWRLSLGLEYGLSATWTLRSGFMYDQTPIPGSEQRTPMIPDSDRYWIAVGATWHPSKNLAVDLAYSHLFFNDAHLRDTIDLDPSRPGVFTDTLVGSYDNAVDALAMELRYAF